MDYQPFSSKLGQIVKIPGGGGEGRAYSFVLLSLVMYHLTTHRFRDGAPFLVRMETPPTFRRSVRCFHILCSIASNCVAYLVSFVSCRLWPPSISWNSDRFLATIYCTELLHVCHIRLFSSSVIHAGGGKLRVRGRWWSNVGAL